MSNIPEREESRFRPIAPTDKRTALDIYKERQEKLYKESISTKDFNQAVTKSIEQMKKKYPQEADDLLNLQTTGQGSLSPTAQRFLMGQTRQATKTGKQLNTLERRSQFAGLLTVASTANSALNVVSRATLGAGAYNAQVAGKVINFESQQKNWENLKRGTFLAGSIASFAKVAGFFGPAASFGTIVAVGATLAGQVARIAGDNKALSGERQRQDSNSEYHRLAYGDIITRGNR
jgi:hypothetical protein